MKIKDTALRAIQDRAAEVFRAYGVELHQKGGSLIGRCPFHEDTKPSFAVRLSGSKAGQWSCFACDHKGRDIFSFVAQMEGLNTASDFPQVVKTAAALCGLGWKLTDEGTPDESTEPEQKQERPTESKPQVPPRYFNAEADAMAQEVEQTNLYKYLCRLWDDVEVKRVMALYKVGRGHYINAPRSAFNKSDDWAMNPRPCRLQNSLASNSFPSIDTAGNVHAIKIIPYPATDHHRIQDAQPDKAKLYWIKPEQNPGTYFGCHLLQKYPAAPVAVVESEKSAVIGSLFAPAYVWIATQTLSNFKPCHEMEALAGRELHVFPDTDGMELWRAATAQLTAAGYDIKFRDEVMKLFPAESKLDIADFMVMEQERRAGNE